MPAAIGVAGEERANDGGKESGEIFRAGDDARRFQFCQEIIAELAVDLLRGEAVNNQCERALALAQQEVRRLAQRIARLNQQRAKSRHVDAIGVDADKWAARESALLEAHPPCSVMSSQSLLPCLLTHFFRTGCYV